MNHHHYDDVAPRHSPKKRRSFDNTTPEYEAMGTHHYNDVASSDSPSDIGTDLPRLTQVTTVQQCGTVDRGVSTDLQSTEVSRTGIKCRSMLDTHIKCKAAFDKTAFRMSGMRRRDPAKRAKSRQGPEAFTINRGFRLISKGSGIWRENP
ncbi:unnamed protein product [Cochlearia groenlandica]